MYGNPLQPPPPERNKQASLMHKHNNTWTGIRRTSADLGGLGGRRQKPRASSSRSGPIEHVGINHIEPR
jgi:hypothetical protein